MRELTAAFITAVTAGTVRPILLVEFTFDDAALRFWSGLGDLAWNGQTWTGAGHLLTVQPPAETQQLDAHDAMFVLSGAPESVLAIALQSGGLYSGRPVRFWLGVLDASGALIADPVRLFSGKMNVMEIDDNPEQPLITLTAVNDLAVLNKARERRNTHEDQQIDYPGDLFFAFLARAQDKEIAWGQAPTK